MDWERYADATAQALGLPLAPEHRPGVLHYLQMVGQMAPRVMDFPLSPAVESANAFCPVSPDDLKPEHGGQGQSAEPAP